MNNASKVQRIKYKNIFFSKNISFKVIKLMLRYLFLHGLFKRDQIYEENSQNKLYLYNCSYSFSEC